MYIKCFNRSICRKQLVVKLINYCNLFKMILARTFRLVNNLHSLIWWIKKREESSKSELSSFLMVIINSETFYSSSWTKKWSIFIYFFVWSLLIVKLFALSMIKIWISNYILTKSSVTNVSIIINSLSTSKATSVNGDKRLSLNEKTFWSL